MIKKVIANFWLNITMLEVCTGFKVKTKPGPYPRSSDPTRVAQLDLEPEPDTNLKYFFPTTNSQQKKKKKVCISRLYAMVSKQIHKETDSSRLGHFIRQNKKHLPVMKVYEHQVQRSHTFCRVYEWLYGQDDNSSTLQIMVIFVS